MSFTKHSLVLTFGFLLTASLMSQPQNMGPRKIFFTVEGKQPITHLKVDEVRILEDGKAQPLESLAPAESIPLSVTLLIDTSTSAQAELPSWRSEIEPFLNALLRPSVDTAEVISFNNQRSLPVQQFTGSVPLLLASIDKLKFGGALPLTMRLRRQCGKLQQNRGEYL